MIRKHFNAVSANYNIETKLDYSDCYYEGDCPSIDTSLGIYYEKEIV